MPKKITTADFKDRVASQRGQDYEVLGDYVHSGTKILVRHSICGYEWEVVPSKFTSYTNGCPKCANNLRLNTTIFKERVYSKVGDEYSVMSEYKTADTKVIMRHNSSCQYEWRITPHNFLSSNHRCPRCANCAKLTTEDFKQRVYDLVANEYLVVGNYRSIGRKVSLLHVACGHMWGVTPHNFLDLGTRCPKCAFSKGETHVAGILDSLDIVYEAQKTFEDMVYVGKLRLDFYIPSKNMGIEYDGEQHYRPVAFGGVSKEKAQMCFEVVKERDAAKTTYCNQNNIHLLRIPYYLDKDEVKNLVLTTLYSQEVKQSNSHQSVSW